MVTRGITGIIQMGIAPLMGMTPFGITFMSAEEVLRAGGAGQISETVMELPQVAGERLFGESQTSAGEALYELQNILWQAAIFKKGHEWASGARQRIAQGKALYQHHRKFFDEIFGEMKKHAKEMDSIIRDSEVRMNRRVTVEEMQLLDGAKQVGIPPSYRKRVEESLGGKDAPTRWGKPVEKLTDLQLAQLAIERNILTNAPKSEAPVGQGGDMAVRGAANQAQIDQFKVRQMELPLEQVKERVRRDPDLGKPMKDQLIEGLNKKALEETMDLQLQSGKVLPEVKTDASGAVNTVGLIHKWFKDTMEPITRGDRPKTTAENAVYQWDANFKTGAFIGRLLETNIKHNLPKEIRDIVPFIIEGTYKGKVPETLKPWMPVLRDYYNTMHGVLRESGLFDNVSFRDNYVSHIWDLTTPKFREIASNLSKRNPFLLERKIPTLQEGIEMGLKPKTTDIARLIGIYNDYAVKTLSTRKLIKDLRSMTDANGKALILRHRKDVPADYVLYDHPLMNQMVYRGTMKGRGAIVTPQKVMVHKDIAPTLDVIFKERHSSKLMRGYQVMNALAKKASLSISFFHHFALTESGFASGVWRMPTLWNPAEVARFIQKGEMNLPAYRNPTIAMDGLRHGLELGHIADVQVATVQRLLQNTELRLSRIHERAGSAFRVVRKANDLWDKALWDYYHSGLKLLAYETQVAKLAKLNPNIPIEKIKTETARSVNDAFGGQNWTRLMVNPRTQQYMQWTMLAPDWTISNLRIFGRALQSENLAKILGKDQQAWKIQGQLGRRYWARTAFSFFVYTNLLNQFLTKQEFGEGRFIWENEPGQEWNIFLGKNDDGSNRYMRLGKQFREPFEWMSNPLHTFGKKMAPWAQIAFEQLSGHSTTGFPQEFAEMDFWSTENAISRTKGIGEKFIPFAIRGNQFALTAPTSKGLTPYKAGEMLRQAMLDRDDAQVKRIIRGAIENNLEPSGRAMSAIARIRAKDLGPPKARVAELQRMLRAGSITPEEFRERAKPYMDKIQEIEQIIQDYQFLVR
jgi:hypothetical protein